jgi:hypothetical protein
LLHDAQVTATTEGLAVAEAVTVLLPVGVFGVVTSVGLALAGVIFGVRSPVRSTSLCGTATTGGTVAPLLAGAGWGTVIET